ncbi:hypothetical protein D9C73_023276 [Collichthys lucidus]|uniref:Uncharacterized protein n=1 Tax=Collichthys lucidus TaxID=240159 RepID=A0A4U5VIW6_COLLU|nr:hypothetical protein D9C73_023276 [Collichthys lucidus]
MKSEREIGGYKRWGTGKREMIFQFSLDVSKPSAVCMAVLLHPPPVYDYRTHLCVSSQVQCQTRTLCLHATMGIQALCQIHTEKKTTTTATTTTTTAATINPNCKKKQCHHSDAVRDSRSIDKQGSRSYRCF